jgi:hypothetical protein
MKRSMILRSACLRGAGAEAPFLVRAVLIGMWIP